MPRELLTALAADVVRLLDAGGSVAAGDEGLRRREKVLRELGQKVPVLGQIADAVGRVTAAAPPQATRALLDLLLVVRQVLATLATAGKEGPLEPVPQSGPWATPIPAHDLYPLVEALAETGAGRLKTIEDAVARGIPADLRLVDRFESALENSYAPLGDLVAERVLPAFGRALLAELPARIDFKGKRLDARRLLAICSLDRSTGADLCRAVLTDADSSPSLRFQALESLSEIDPSAAEGSALKQLGQKKLPAEVRNAALAALGRTRSDAALEALLTALAQDEVAARAAAAALTGMPHPRATQRLTEVLAATAERVPPAEKPKRPAPARGRKQPARPTQDATVERLVTLVEILGGRRDREAVPALRPFLRYAVANLREAAADALIVIGDPAGVEAAADLLDDPQVWRSAARAAWKLGLKERYERLAPLCEHLSDARKPRRERGEFVLDLFEEEAGGDVPPTEEALKPRTDWDPRWAKLLLKYADGPNRPGVAIALEVVLSTRAAPELLKRLAVSVKKGECGVVEALGRLRVREAIEPMIQLLPAQKSHHYCIHDALRRIGDAAAIPPLKELLANTGDRAMQRRIEEILDDLERRAEPAVR
jgi:HEAT repeat protein